ncbi:hypothetical protein [Virgibacillus kimchii]
MKKLLVLLSALLFILPSISNSANIEEREKVKPFAEDWYVTPEDIIKDIIFSSIDKRVMQEYPGNDVAAFGWRLQRIVNIVYNNNHSYDISVKVQVPEEKNKPGYFAEDLVKVRVSPSCDSPKISCTHGFSVEVIEYKKYQNK